MIDQMREFIGETRQAAVGSAASHFGVSPERLEVIEIPQSLRVANLGARVLVLAAPRAVEAELGKVGQFVRAMLEDLGLDRGLRLDESEEEGRVLVRVYSPQVEEAERKIGGVESALAHLADRAAQELVDEDAAAVVVLAREPRKDRDAGRRRSGGGDRDRERGGRGERPRGRDGDRDRPRGDRDRQPARDRDAGRDRDRGSPEKEQELETAARRAAEEVRRSGEPRTLDPMGSRDRWVVHNAVKEVGGVSSVSVGEGDQKRVKIVPD
jgi:predicted RNA-binding protein Jag